MTTFEPTLAYESAKNATEKTICQQFNVAWQSGEPPDLLTFLDGLNERNSPRLVKLLLEVDIAHRSQRSDWNLQEYIERWPEHAAWIKQCILNQETHAPGPARESNRKFPIPETFGRYQIQREIGSGGMGSVYLAYDPRLEIHVALKIPHAHLSESPAFIEQFYLEAQALARLYHPNICRVFDVGQFESYHYISLAFVEGQPLWHDQIRDHQHAADMIRTIALAVDAAHKEGIIHRDLKPANILVRADGSPVVMDFGLALKQDQMRQQHQEGQLLGTIPYMSPEQLRGELLQLGPPADVYSLGVVLYELLTGCRPYESESSEGFVRLVLDTETPPTPVNEHQPEVDSRLASIVSVSLAKDASDRFQTMQAFADALSDFLQAQNDSPTEEKLLDAGCIRWGFIGLGEQAPSSLLHGDRVYLDVGNRLAVGCLDHHQAEGEVSSTRLILQYPEYLSQAIKPWRRPADPFTILLHQHPDLDAVMCGYLARFLLTTGEFPARAEKLADYLDQIDRGAVGMTQERPFSLYAAYLQLVHRLTLCEWDSPDEVWEACVEDGCRIGEYVLKQLEQESDRVVDIDAFKTPRLFRKQDRQEVLSDIERYQRKLSDSDNQARQVVLELPLQSGMDTKSVPFLFISNVQRGDDSQRCIFFKDWARTDTKRCPNTNGYVGLMVYQDETPSTPRRVIISVRPEDGVSLNGLAELLDRAESNRRRAVFGNDDRVVDPSTQKTKIARKGYGNSDPWYDGRGHSFTIIDTPRSGTLLTLKEVEEIVLQFGKAKSDQVEPVV